MLSRPAADRLTWRPPPRFQDEEPPGPRTGGNGQGESLGLE